MEKDTKIATFTNFSDTKFIGQWDGALYPFEPGMKMFLPDWQARHFAKHLANRELLSIPDGEKHTSPKKPEEDLIFMKMFNQAYIPSETPAASAAEINAEVINRNNTVDISNELPVQEANQVIEVPDDGEDEFEGFQQDSSIKFQEEAVEETVLETTDEIPEEVKSPVKKTKK